MDYPWCAVLLTDVLAKYQGDLLDLRLPSGHSVVYKFKSLLISLPTLLLYRFD